MSSKEIAERLKKIIKDNGGQLAVSRATKTDQGNISKMINGKAEISYNFISKLCNNINYSPAWIILGEGSEKINKAESPKLITEIQTLRMEVDNIRLKMQGLDAWLERIKK